MAFYITGDCHGDFSKIAFFCEHHKTTTEDVMIILGDFGVNHWLGEKDVENKKLIVQMPLTFFAVHGNPVKGIGVRNRGVNGIYIRKRICKKVQRRFNGCACWQR